MAAGTTGIIYSNRECLYRLQTLIIDGGTEVLRNVFDQRLPGVPLSVFLAQEKNTIKVLKRQKIITKAQYDLMYSPGRPPNSADFDITLIMCLLRNLPSLGLNQNYTWNVPPQPADLSLEADLWRLKGFRNEVAHISSTTGFKQMSFITRWTEIEQVLLRLNTAVPNPLSNFCQTIDNYKYIPLDAAAEQRNQRLIEQWRQMERGLETEMLLIKDGVKSISEDIKTIEQDVGDTKQSVKNIEKDLTYTKQNIMNIEQDVRDTKQDIKYLEQDTRDTSQDIKILKQDVRDTKDGVENIEQVVIYTRQDVKGLERNVDETKEDVHVIKQQVKDIKADITYQKTEKTKKAADTTDTGRHLLWFKREPSL